MLFGRVPNAADLMRPIRLPLFDALLRKFPMLETLDDPIEIMIFGFELPDRGGRMSGNQDFLSGFAEHRHLDMTIGFLRHILFELIEQFDVFVSQFEYRAPDLLARRRHHAGEAAPPL